ncbi:Maf family protein [Luteimonas deserti]|uniref:7-methyl-GTP pyrophosphatase n=1 Tax=Luteimonas deserti TaxID=2752306 RepID=A0A7Z0QTZ0_9GAMM|nr:Maf family nucleotide pyrophosphatase [Luteimonas deserti]NYZ64019.1 septum formation inhibitor Maf [Luteimonas deserti]
MPAPLVLGSTSPYRRELLERLRLPFTCERPEVDEQPLDGERPDALARRLAAAKAEAVARRLPGHWVIGSDQVAALDDRVLGKPGHRDGAIGQLTAMSGCRVRFHTAIAVACAGHPTLQADDLTEVRLRALDPAEIVRYVDAETPFDCAGSFKCEALGIVLFDAIHTDDPTALVGLPLIATARLLRQAGFVLP